MSDNDDGGWVRKTIPYNEMIREMRDYETVSVVESDFREDNGVKILSILVSGTSRSGIEQSVSGRTLHVVASRSESQSDIFFCTHLPPDVPIPKRDFRVEYANGCVEIYMPMEKK
jgi:hypothetical protein